MYNHSGRVALALVHFVFGVCALVAVEATAADVELLPSDPGAWINSAPLTAEMLKGKGAVIWFYEEQCPNCREKWPGMYEVAQKFAGQPLLFIAVNSGNPRPNVEQYARGVNLKWPVIVDSTRAMEKIWLNNEISLQNIHQVGILLPSGQRSMGNWNDLEGAARKALDGASWKIDPKTIPAVFQPTWQLVELGKYSEAALLLKKGLVTSNAEVKEAANRVMTLVKGEMQPLVDRGLAAQKAGDSWAAHKQLAAVSSIFAGLDLPAEAVTAQKELATNEAVKKQLDGLKQLEAIKKTFPTARTDVSRKRIITRLETLIKQFPQTDAATEAQSILDQAAAQPAGQ